MQGSVNDIAYGQMDRFVPNLPHHRNACVSATIRDIFVQIAPFAPFQLPHLAEFDEPHIRNTPLVRYCTGRGLSCCQYHARHACGCHTHAPRDRRDPSNLSGSRRQDQRFEDNDDIAAFKKRYTEVFPPSPLLEIPLILST